MKSIFTALFILFSFLCCHAAPEKELHLFILMGQSNMAGYGDILPEDKAPATGIYYIPTITKPPYQWLPARHPLHNRLKTDCFGLGIPFAVKYRAEHGNVDVGLIPVAWGGAPIKKLVKGGNVYSDAVKKALTMAEDKRVKIKGILWHQGESDTITEKLANSYEGTLHQLIADLRKDLGIPDLPFVAGNLAEFYGTNPEHNSPQRVALINKVKQTLRDLPSKVKHCGFVESTGCESHDRHMVHFDRKAYIILGERYAEQINKLCK